MVSDEARMVAVVMEREGEGRSHYDDIALRSILDFIWPKASQTLFDAAQSYAEVGCALSSHR